MWLVLKQGSPASLELSLDQFAAMVHPAFIPTSPPAPPSLPAIAFTQALAGEPPLPEHMNDPLSGDFVGHNTFRSFMGDLIDASSSLSPTGQPGLFPAPSAGASQPGLYAAPSAGPSAPGLLPATGQYDPYQGRVNAQQQAPYAPALTGAFSSGAYAAASAGASPLGLQAAAMQGLPLQGMPNHPNCDDSQDLDSFPVPVNFAPEFSGQAGVAQVVNDFRNASANSLLTGYHTDRQQLSNHSGSLSPEDFHCSSELLPSASAPVASLHGTTLSGLVQRMTRQSQPLEHAASAQLLHSQSQVRQQLQAQGFSQATQGQGQFRPELQPAGLDQMSPGQGQFFSQSGPQGLGLAPQDVAVVLAGSESVPLTLPGRVTGHVYPRAFGHSQSDKTRQRMRRDRSFGSPRGEWCPAPCDTISPLSQQHKAGGQHDAFSLHNLGGHHRF